jgi:hypothetical protein
MNICPNCEQNNLDGALLCEHCGRNLANMSRLNTRVVEGSTDPLDEQWHGSSPFNRDAQIILYVRDEKEPLVLPRKSRLVLGRVNAGKSPDIDLSQYHALEKGVSTEHAALQRSADRLEIIDLNSTNGTFLNRRRIAPSQAMTVLDGAEVQLGELVLRLYFETTA